MYPELDLGAITTPSWPVVIILAVLSCWALLVGRMHRLGHSPAAVLIWVVLALPVGALGASVGEALIASLGDVAQEGGYTMLGAIVGCFAFTTAWAPIALRSTAGAVLDPVAFTLPLCHGIGRAGCLLQGCCFGREAVDAPAWLTVAAAAYAPDTDAALASDPTALLWNLPLMLAMLSAAGVVVAELMWRHRIRLRLPVGSIALVAIALLCLGRASIDAFRGGAVAGDTDAWTASAWFVGAIALGGLVLLRGGPRYA